MKKIYEVKERVWLFGGKASWYFVTLSKEVATDIDYFFTQNKRGFGSLPVLVTVGGTTWKTSIFPDKKSCSYLLPLKADVRKK
jgi:hypothetical protein